MRMKKILSALLVLALLLSVLPIGVFASSEIYYVEEHCTELHPSRKSTVGPELAPGNHALYVDRLADLPDYALEYYRWLENNTGLDGALVDPTVGTEHEKGYYHLVTKVEKSKQFNITSTTTKEEVRQMASEVAGPALSEEFAAFMAYAGAIWDAFGRDHNEVFWLSGWASYSYFGQWSWKTKGNVVTVTYKADMVVWLQKEDFDIRDPKYRTSAAVANAMDVRDQAVEEILEDCPKDNVYDQIVYLNDELTKRNAYNSVVATGITDGVDDDAWRCISALEGRNGANGPVCEGYARAFKVLCDELEIPCVLVDGDARNDCYEKPGGHMWNYVQLDDGWYAVDVTWNDPYISTRPLDKVSGRESQKWLLLGSETEVASGLSFLESHEVVNMPRLNGMAFTNGPVLEADTYDPNAVTKYSISGTVSSAGDGEVTVQLLQGNTPVSTLTVSGSKASYRFEGILPGDYQLTVSKADHVTRTESLTVSNVDVTQDIQLYKMGDVSGDGYLNVGDVSRIYGYIKGTAKITDPYILLCADLTGDGQINVGDVSFLYAKIRRGAV